ncbi:TRAP transporter permease [Afipia clevelandensis]|uniref:TRAP transporter, 4TM/12TM fusion protein n=1 Tax=Afipia clevelandensis ATCC 49720 TaxID=883079 RepID=K8P0S6_9BRAD|nr:TRAP transporter permease [Afipia clevelandensis]EKS33250.1 TRAP transporter, 4TM/12TM fusion protein [Afipia clevelandensis ATCC 49720]
MKLDFSYGGVVRMATTLISVAMVIFHVWAIVNGAPEAIVFRGTHLLFALTLLFLIYRSSGNANGTPSVLDLLLLALAIAPIIYLFANYDYVINRIFYVDDLTTADMVMGTIMTVMVLEAARRVIGLALPITAVVFIVYGLFVAKLDPMRLLDQLYMTTEGIFGIPLSVSASYVLIFVLFGSFMERTGTGQLFMDFAMSLTGHTAGGPGKVSCVSSALFGTISGSAVANVMVDGPITIPLMKRSGFPPHFAAGVEAVASTGGQIMPPIMGAAAFVMAEFLGVSYGQVVLWAIIPAVLYYVACFSAVHFEAKRRGLVGVPRSELPKLGDVMRERGHLFLPVLAILVVMYSGFSSPLAALAGTLACFPVAALRKSTRHYVTFENLIGACVDGARNALPVALACAAAGVVIAVVTLSGLGIVFTQFVVHLSQNYLLLALVFTMIAGIVLGMGMPTTPAYIIMTALLVPAIVKFGIPVPAAHMFAFYFAVLSAITPPVALAVFAAAGIARSDLWKTGLAAVRIAATSFIVPFMFVYEPALLMIGDWPTIIWSSITAGVGVLLFAAGLHGYFLTHSKYWQSAALAVGGLLLIEPGLVTDVIGATIALAVAATQHYSRRNALAPAPELSASKVSD